LTELADADVRANSTSRGRTSRLRGEQNNARSHP